MNETQPARVTPRYIRLPRPGTQCAYTGLTRSKMNQLVLPSETNSHRPPVRSVSLKEKSQRHAVRLIDFESLMAYLDSLASNPELN